jgi:hypothetical protein
MESHEQELLTLTTLLFDHGFRVFLAGLHLCLCLSYLLEDIYHLEILALDLSDDVLEHFLFAEDGGLVLLVELDGTQLVPGNKPEEG